MSETHPSRLDCRAHNQAGAPCGNKAIPGGRVCRYHGGRAPQVLAGADQRMRDLVQPAVSSLARLIDKDEFQATRYVLDWAGFKAVDKVQSDGEVTIVVRRVDQPILDAGYSSADADD